MVAHARKELGGVVFKIDRPQGFKKTWDSGKSWTYPVDYGYFPKLKGEDGEALDAFVGDDPKGHLESFTKLKPDPKDASRMIVDETKFLPGVSDDERKKIYSFYGKEVGDKRVYKSWDEVRAAAETFHGKHRRAVERAAKVVHEQWAEHAKSLLKSEDISPERAKRWRKLINTPYHRLSEAEKMSDRVWARRAVEAQLPKVANLAAMLPYVAAAFGVEAKTAAIGLGQYMQMAERAPNPMVAHGIVTDHFDKLDALNRVKKTFASIAPAPLRAPGAQTALLPFKPAELRMDPNRDQVMDAIPNVNDDDWGSAFEELDAQANFSRELADPGFIP